MQSTSRASPLRGAVGEADCCCAEESSASSRTLGSRWSKRRGDANDLLALGPRPDIAVTDVQRIGAAWLSACELVPDSNA